MSATAKKAAMRGEAPAELELTDEDFAEFDKIDPEELEEEAPAEDDQGTGLDELPLPHGVEVEEDTGDWLYTLQYKALDKIPFDKVRIPAVIYAKDIRRSGQGRNEAETVFFMLCSMSKVPAKMMDKLDSRDYVVLQRLVQRRALKNSRAVLRSIGGQGSE